MYEAGRAPSTGHAAVWIPDTEVNKCMHCKKTQFTMINRRHHCRNCGNVICGNCSRNKFLIPSQSKTPVRVCDTCFSDLGSARTNYNIPKLDSEQSDTPSVADTSETSIYDEPKISGENEEESGSTIADRPASDTEESSDEEDSKTVDQLNEKVSGLEIDSTVSTFLNFDQTPAHLFFSRNSMTRMFRTKKRRQTEITNVVKAWINQKRKSKLKRFIEFICPIIT